MLTQVHSVLKGYMTKKGHKRKNWTERWFVLQPTSLSYYISEDLVERRGHVVLDRNCSVEVNNAYLHSCTLFCHT